MPQIGRFLITMGVLLIVLGGLVLVLGGLPRLPGDIYVQRKGFSLYVPVVGSLLLSIVLTILLNLFFARR
ncbi:MAG TPA: DUF2905 domain-containing protein [bacterium]|nr:DUF2905 domain-containing protein [bacterium]